MASVDKRRPQASPQQADRDQIKDVDLIELINQLDTVQHHLEKQGSQNIQSDNFWSTCKFFNHLTFPSILVDTFVKTI